MLFLVSDSQNGRDIVPQTSGMDSSICGFDQIFCFTYERERRYEGAWHREVVELSPKVQFADLDHAEKDDALVPLGEETSSLLQALSSAQHHIPMSQGVIRNGVTHVTSGPLVGFERKIVWLDRHKKLAWLAPEGCTDSVKARRKAGLLFGETYELMFAVGLEITEKS